MIPLRRLLEAAAVLLLAGFSFFLFPGHTILQSDTQIYIPILEHLRDPGLYAHDFIATRPHVTFTLYDESALLLREVTGAGFEPLLMTLQFLFRAVGIAALWWLASSFGLPPPLGWLVAAIVSLGASVVGPAVLTVEYEPVPRGFAMPFLLLALAMFAHARWLGAGLAAGVALLFHPPTALAIVALLAVGAALRKKWETLIGPAAALLCFALLVATAPSMPDRQEMFGRLSPAMEELQRYRASYNWVSIWWPKQTGHHLFLFAAAIGGFFRIRAQAPSTVRHLFWLLPALGLASVGVSFVTVEEWRWSLMPQFQPARYLMLVALFAVWNTGVAGVLAARGRSALALLEAGLWFSIALVVPLDVNLQNLLSTAPLALTRIGLALAMGAGCAIAAWWSFGSISPLRHAAVLCAAAAPFLLNPTLGQVRNYPPLHNEHLNQLAAWARQNTPRDALFQFADAGRSLEAGVFRARSLRALYCDWKGGGQVNFLKGLAVIWKDRWFTVEKPLPVERYRQLGIDFVVYSKGGQPQGWQPIYRAGPYAVLDLRKLPR